MILPAQLPVAEPVTIEQEERVKSREEIMEILEAFDLTGSLRDAGELAGCSHHVTQSPPPSRLACWSESCLRAPRRDRVSLGNSGGDLAVRT